MAPRLSLCDPSLPVDLGEVLSILRHAYPNEGCGLILHGPRGHRVVALANVAAAPRHHFQLDPQVWLETLLDAERNGESLACLFHSHPDGPADFSAKDALAAAPGGAPLLPGVSYLVVSMVREGPAEARVYRWSGAFFAEVARAVPGF